MDSGRLRLTERGFGGVGVDLQGVRGAQGPVEEQAGHARLAGGPGQGREAVRGHWDGGDGQVAFPRGLRTRHIRPGGHGHVLRLNAGRVL